MNAFFLKQKSIEKFFILDSHPRGKTGQRGTEFEDEDYVSYSYSMHYNNKLVPGSAFLYRKPGGVFSIYGGGVIERISDPSVEGLRKATITNGFSFKKPILKGDPFIEEFKWENKEKPIPPKWKGFWNNYGILEITKNDFWGLVDNREIIPIVSKTIEREDKTEEDTYLEKMRETSGIKGNKHFNDAPRARKKQQDGTSCGVPRDKQVSMNALCNADNHCELGNNHKSFLRRNSNVLYCETHHLVPLKYQTFFENDLDIEENIVALCSNCHNQIHYGKGAEELLRILYEKRYIGLQRVGINVDLSELIEMYNL